MRQREIDEKLEKLGIEPRTELTVPELHAPHARSASVCDLLLSFDSGHTHEEIT